jgi:PAS domain S-box-containing protein
MKIAPRPDNETERLAALERLEILDSLPQRAFDDITTLASTICGTPIALISLVDSERQWFKSRVGLDATQTSREVAFCAHAILEPGEVMVVQDATRDQRFRDNPLVTEAPDIRFYAGAPIVTEGGHALGTVCVIDRHVRDLSAAQIEALRALSRLVVSLLEQEKNRRDKERLATTEARRRNELLTAVATEALDLKAFVDNDYVYRYVNQIYLDYWGRTRDEVEGRPVAELLGDEAFYDLVKPNLDLALSGRRVSLEVTIDFPGRGPTHTEVTYLPARDADGAIIGAVMRVHDIQKLKERETQLSNTVAMLESKSMEQQRFIHIVSHDLREPVNTIVNFSSLLVEDHGTNLPPNALRYARMVHSGGERMKLLLDDLIDLVRLEKQVVESHAVDLNELFAAVCDDLALAISRVGGRIDSEPLPVIAGDATLLRMALQNLVANGIKFARPGVPPAVRVSCYPASDDHGHEIRVCDNGIGIPEGQLENIFDVFKRLNPRKQYEGTGLGLSICRRIAQMHGGNVHVSSELGQGSCFTITLPGAIVATPQDHFNASN